ncbi:hypothetical protein KDA_54480 [Dictyobacter alpinus]|uniref:Uncharacterized protein n=1 Tax=Dictyobacter alpinus TaxID=2014873 RepID=A0A402BEZ1_9CHLR|nr:hypothetical protein [Dictyobacter alpinus]GCE29964.1 hypothetical protein KDA_54480 [Dictyobacter alpinus]
MILVQMIDLFTKPFNWLWLSAIIAGIVFVYISYRYFKLSIKDEQDLVWHKRYKLWRAVQFTITAICSVAFGIIYISIKNSGLSIVTQNNILMPVVIVNIAIVWLIIMPLAFFANTRKNTNEIEDLLRDNLLYIEMPPRSKNEI